MFRYNDFTISPHWGEFVIEDGVLLALLPPAFFVLGLGKFPFRWCFLILMCIVMAYLMYRHRFITTIKYRVGTEQLMVECGVLGIRRNYIEMYRIVDYAEHRSVLHRLFGIKAVTIYSTDRTTPCLTFLGIPEDYDIIAAIRERVEYNKKLKGIYEITNR